MYKVIGKNTRWQKTPSEVVLKMRLHFPLSIFPVRLPGDADKEVSADFASSQMVPERKNILKILKT